MNRITQFDIDRLRNRIHQSAVQRFETSPRKRMEARPECRSRPAVPNREAMTGEVLSNSLGSYLLQEHFYTGNRMHGIIPVSRLAQTPAGWIHKISEGQIPPSSPECWAFLDTETTGLAGGTGTCAFLVGVGTLENEGFRVQLFFMRDYDEESALLQGLAEHLKNYAVLVTYNGKSYDGPLLDTRYRLKRQQSPLDRMHHLDLLHPARRIWDKRLPNCRLGTIESDILGFERENDVPGALIPQRYFEYLRSGRSSLLDPVFHHNVLDIVSLGCLSTVLLESFAMPDDAPLCHGEDMLGLARWLRKIGDEEHSLELYRKAVHTGLPRSGLFPSLWESAQLEKRTGNHSTQLRLLHDLARISAAYRAAAFVEIAKHYEHREHNYKLALEFTRNAIQYASSPELTHREARLLHKMTNHQVVAA